MKINSPVFGWLHTTLTLSLLLLWSGCQPDHTSSPQVSDNSSNPRLTTSRAAPLLRDLPTADRILLASLQPRLEPNRMIALRPPQGGRLQLRVESLIQPVKEDQLIAILEPKALEAEAHALDLWREQLEARQTLEAELELPLQRLQAEKQLDEARRSLRVWEMFQNDTERGRRALELLGIDPGRGDPAEAQRLRWEIELLETRLRYLQSDRPVSDLELQSRRVEWEQRQMDFQKREAMARLSAPFDGELRLLVRPPEQGDEVWVQGGEDIALVRDLSRTVIRLRPDDAPFASAPFSELQLEVRLPGIGERTALPLREEMESSSNRQERVWVFSLDTTDVDPSRLPIGAPVHARLFQTLPEDTPLLSKSSLIASRRAHGDTWEDIFLSVYPDRRLLAIGQSELAIAP